jgi:hypothetical protein
MEKTNEKRNIVSSGEHETVSRKREIVLFGIGMLTHDVYRQEKRKAF